MCVHFAGAGQTCYLTRLTRHGYQRTRFPSRGVESRTKKIQTSSFVEKRIFSPVRERKKLLDSEKEKKKKTEINGRR